MNDEMRQVILRIADHVTRAQRIRGVSDAALAERSGVSRAEIVGLKRGDIDPAIDVFYRLAGALDIKPGDLFSGVEWVADEGGGGRFILRDEDPQ